jgi:hypothetical protein
MTTGTPAAECVLPQLALAPPPDAEEHPVSTAAAAMAVHSSASIRVTR